MSQGLSEEEKVRVAYQVDYFMDLIAKKYSINHDEVIEALRWVKERKDFSDKFKSTGLTTLLGVLVTAILFALWEGLKTLLGRSSP